MIDINHKGTSYAFGMSISMKKKKEEEIVKDPRKTS
jgi:hypothetical protein